MDDIEAADINRRIASRVRALRTDAGFTLDALARRTGVSRSMLSVIERGQSSPTAVVLEKLATGLGVSLGALFDEMPATPEPLSRASERIGWQDPASGYRRWNLSPPGFASAMRLVDVELPPGARVHYETTVREPALHQQIWLREGRLDFALGERNWQLQAGDCLAMRLDALSAFHNPGTVPARYLVAIVGEKAPS